VCGERPREGSTKKCAECKERNKGIRKRTEENKTAAGLCISAGCTEPAKPGCKMCQKCISRSSANTSAAYRRKKTAGFCPYCPEGTPCAEGHRACEKHLNYLNTYGKNEYVRCKKEGICYFCSEPKRTALPGKAYCEEHRQANCQRILKLHHKRRQMVLDYYGRECKCCGLTLVNALQIDHIHGGGNQHRKQIGQSGLYRWLIEHKFPPGYQTLCVMCNWMKSHYGACPHTLMPYAAQELTWKYTKELAKLLKEQA
jgi:hypothetical protein